MYRLKHPFGDGATHVVLDPMNFIARLATLVPRPRAHLTRYHGVFAPNFKHRHRIIPNPVHQSAREPHASRPAPMSWMQRLKRVFRIEHCGMCGGTLRVIACIETPEVIERILTHLATRNTACSDSPRAPPLRASGARHGFRPPRRNRPLGDAPEQRRAIEVAKCRRETVERIIAVAMDAPLDVTELR